MLLGDVVGYYAVRTSAPISMSCINSDPFRRWWCVLRFDLSISRKPYPFSTSLSFVLTHSCRVLPVPASVLSLSHELLILDVWARKSISSLLPSRQIMHPLSSSCRLQESTTRQNKFLTDQNQVGKRASEDGTDTNSRYYAFFHLDCWIF